MFAVNHLGQIVATTELRDLLERVQMSVNDTVTYQSDAKTYGEVDKWAYPRTDGFRLVGDCEDYCLYKRRILEAAGVPTTALLLTICTDPNKQGHCVLTAVTTTNDYILCNIHPFVTTPQAMRAEGYTFLYRQQLGKGINDPWDVLKK